MFNHAATNANKSIEPPLPYPGATPDAERAEKQPLPEPPYEPYAKKPALPGLPYKPYAQKPALPELPYEPYAKKPPLPGHAYEPYKGIFFQAEDGIRDLTVTGVQTCALPI